MQTEHWVELLVFSLSLMDQGLQLWSHLQVHLQASIQHLCGIISNLLIGHLSGPPFRQTLLNCY